MLDKLKQFKDLKKQAGELKSNLAQETITGEALNGQVKITMDGNQEVQEVFINESLLSADQQENLQDGIKEAFGKAVKEVQTLMARKIQSGEIQMPM